MSKRYKGRRLMWAVLTVCLVGVALSIALFNHVISMGKNNDDQAEVTNEASYKEKMLNDIKNGLLEIPVEVVEVASINEAKDKAGFAPVVPEYLPERFKLYGIYIHDNPGIPTMKVVRQIWYDPIDLEVLTVTTSETPDDYIGKISEEIHFNEYFESRSYDGTLKPINDVYVWAKYVCWYEFTRDNISVQGHMLVNNEGKRNEYEKILKSLQR